MTIDELQNILQASPEASLCISCNDKYIPAHFHITEVGHVVKKFVDCGGTTRETEVCVLQLWVANDYKHRLTAGKLNKIITKAKEILPIDKLPIELEYEDGRISQYLLTEIGVNLNMLTVFTGIKHTDCLAKDKCGC